MADRRENSSGDVRGGRLYLASEQVLMPGSHLWNEPYEQVMIPVSHSYTHSLPGGEAMINLESTPYRFGLSDSFWQSSERMRATQEMVQRMSVDGLVRAPRSYIRIQPGQQPDHRSALYMQDVGRSSRQYPPMSTGDQVRAQMSSIHVQSASVIHETAQTISSTRAPAQGSIRRIATTARISVRGRAPATTARKSVGGRAPTRKSTRRRTTARMSVGGRAPAQGSTGST